MAIEWQCFKCKEKAIPTNVDLSYLGITRSAYALQCPKCKAAYIEEDFAMNIMARAEPVIEMKRA